MPDLRQAFSASLSAVADVCPPCASDVQLQEQVVPRLVDVGALVHELVDSWSRGAPAHLQLSLATHSVHKTRPPRSSWRDAPDVLGGVADGHEVSGLTLHEWPDWRPHREVIVAPPVAQHQGVVHAQQGVLAPELLALQVRQPSRWRQASQPSVQFGLPAPNLALVEMPATASLSAEVRQRLRRAC